MERTCEWCGGAISAERRTAAKTCSDACRDQRRLARAREHAARKYVPRPKRIQVCERCACEYTPKRPGGKYCSRRCQWSADTIASRPRIRPCSKCGVDTPTRPGFPVCDGCKVDPRPGNAARDRKRNLRAYGLTLADYDRMHAEQDGRCAICGRTDAGRHLQAHFSVDHCHDTGVVRGLLCHPCNLGIGYLQDDPTIMRAAAAYVAAAATRKAS